MSNQNVFEQNGVQRPMFAPVSQSSKGKYEEIDLSDIFAEYLNDGDDPLTTFSNFSNLTSMGFQQPNQQQHPQQDQQQIGFNPLLDTPQPLGNQNMLITQNQAPAPGNNSVNTIALPTGRGIKTAFHSGVTAPATQTAQQQQTNLQEPAPKRPKIAGAGIQTSTIPQAGTGQAVVPLNLSTLGTGITSRLGFSLSGGQVTLPQKAPQAKPAPQGNIQLPIGVGIRLGGINPQSTGAMPLNHMQWGATNQWSGMNGTVGATGGISESAMAERRQRNREHAKRSRVRKKFLLESLQTEVRQLQDENSSLRMLIQQRIPQHAQQIIDECCIKSPLFGDETDGNKGDNKDVELTKSDYSLIENLTSGQQNFVLSDPRLPDNPIVFASEGFYQMTGYTREQVLGRNCRFLQGPATDPKAVDVIRTAVANGTDASTCILNYKADGSPFWNQFFVAALRDSENCIVNYVGVQCVIDPDAGASALEDKVDSVLPLQNKGQSVQEK
jgi:PAS domain S-box-containing protein